ncbi:MAG: aldo/keto reductase [Nocardioidaceae bacterium]|nr:aldo/keto reductase [Nocardioidaceae bacterium]
MNQVVPDIRLNNGVEIPQLGFGVFQVPAEDTASVTLTALEVGYRHIDTAAAYGNEEGVGQAVRDSGLAREDVFITTKLWNSDQGYDSALAAFDASCERLALGYVDLYLIHWPTPTRDRYLDTWRAMEKIYADGRSRAIGVSNFQANHLHRLAAESTVPPAVNQIELHPTFTQEPMRDVHAEMGVATEAWSPLGQAQDLDNHAIGVIADRLDKSPAQVILRWHLQLGNIVIPKSVTPERIRDNFDVLNFELSVADMGDLNALDRGNRIGPDPDRFNG